MAMEIGSRFLAGFPWSREKCHEVASSLSGSNDIVPLPVQGGNSYTVRGNTVVIQFRVKPENLAIIDEATSIFGARFVPPVVLRVSQDGIYVYSSPYLGQTYCELGILRVSLEAQKKTMVDLADFLALSCYHSRNPEQSAIPFTEITEYIKQCLDLPHRFTPKIQYILDHIGTDQLSFPCY
jgi:hypothetical protein